MVLVPYRHYLKRRAALRVLTALAGTGIGCAVLVLLGHDLDFSKFGVIFIPAATLVGGALWYVPEQGKLLQRLLGVTQAPPEDEPIADRPLERGPVWVYMAVLALATIIPGIVLK